MTPDILNLIRREAFDCVACWLDSKSAVVQVQRRTSSARACTSVVVHWSIATALDLPLRERDWPTDCSEALRMAWTDATHAAAVALENGASVADVAEALRAPWKAAS